MENSHFSKDQIFKAILGQSTPEERRHGMECLQCREKVEQFLGTVSTFRTALQDWSQRQPVGWMSADPPATRTERRNRSARAWTWAVAGVAVVLLTAIPIYQEQARLQHRARAVEAIVLMEAVSERMSRTVPAPMEPILALVPAKEISNETGELQ